ncbi:MAG: ABC transporter substrate-binding protein [Robiginitomaculum sp.]|nr:ABC transporter substrate-binding protein [Robiginitomaculum sp.]
MNKTKVSLFFLIVFSLLSHGAKAIAGPVEEAFVQQQSVAGLAILSNQELDEATRSEQFGTFIDQIVDIRKVSRFALGKYARRLDPKVLTDFQTAFTLYAKGIYQNSLSQYGGETFTITGSIDRKPGDAVVSTMISGGAVEKPLRVRWRVQTKDGVSKVIDLEAFGIWLAVQQRSEITAYIANHNGDVGAATTMLRGRAQSSGQ